MDATTDSIILTGALALLTGYLGMLAQKYKKEYAMLSEYVPLITKNKDAAFVILGKLSDFYKNAHAASADGVITPEEYERLGREGYAILNSEEVKRLLEGN